jgi:mannose-binding lectin 1
MGAEVRWLFNLVILINIYYSLASIPFRRFEYKYSFKPPYLAQKDGTVPFWEYGGSEYLLASSTSI